MIEKNEKGHIRGLNFRFGNHVSINFFQRHFKRACENEGLKRAYQGPRKTFQIPESLIFINKFVAWIQKALRTFFQWVIFCVNLSGGTPIFVRQPPIFAAGEINKSETREEEEWMHQLVGKNLYHNNKGSSKFAQLTGGKIFYLTF